jgi:cell division protein FtsB
MYSPLTFIVLGVLILIAGYNVWDMYQKSQRTEEALRKTREAYDVLLARQRFLDERLNELDTEAGVEAEIRDRFGVAKPGEEVIVVLSDEEQDAPSTEEESLWGRFREWLSGGNDDYVKE